MMERRRARKQPSGRLGATDIVAVCKAYSQRLKEKPVRVKLHVSTGRVADGTITLDTDPLKGGPAKIVVQAQGSNLFGLVKRKFQHVFRVGELERSRSTHTVFLLRSIKQLAKGNDAMKEEILARSLSLVHKDEAVDMTFANREECDKLGEWIDAKWSVSMIQKSFRGNSRIALALQGKERGGSDGGRAALEDDDEGHREREGVGMVDGAGFGRLPTLDRAAKMKLQDDLLDGVHVAYHDLSLRGYRSNSSPRRLRYDCESKAGLIYLEPSFEGDGPTIIQPISTLIQVGGGPSAFGLTASLLRATADKKEQRAKAVSLVFAERSVDITCGSEEDATELVLYFSEVKGFTRAKPPSQEVDLTPLPIRAAPAPAPAPAAAAQSAAGAGAREALPDSVSKETWRDLGAIGGGTGVGGHRGEHPPARQVAGRAGAAAGAAVHSADPTREKGMDPSFSTRFRSGYRVGDGDEDAELERQASAASGFGAASSLLGAGTHAHRHGNKSNVAPATETDEAALLEKQASAASGFGASPSLRMITSPASPSGGDGGRGGGGNGNGRSSITQHRMWTTHQGTTSAAAAAAAASEEASDAARFRSAPGATRRSTIAGAPDPPKRGMRPAGGSAWERGDKVHSSGQHHNHSRHHGDSKAARGASPTPAAAATEGPHRVGCTVRQLPSSREANEPVQRGRHFSNPGGGDSREPLTSPTAKAREAAARRGHDTGGGGGTTSWVAIPSPTRGSGGTAPPPPLPPREVGGAGGGVEVADHRAAERQRPRSKLATHFPGANRGPSAGAGDGAGGDAGAGAAASRPRGGARPAHPARLGASPTRRPTPFTSPGELVASTRGVEHEWDVIQSRTKPVGAVREAGSGSSGGVGGDASEMTIERRRFGGVERRTVQVRGRGVGGHGSGDASGTGGHANSNSAVGHGYGNIKHTNDDDVDDDDDENYTTVRVKGATFAAKTPPSPESPASLTSDVAHPAHGRRRSCTPTMERPALAAELDRQRLASNPTPDHDRRRRASTPTRVERTGGQRQISPMKDRLNRKTAGLGKAIRGGANKLFASSGGASSGSTSSGTPLSSSGSAGGRRGLGSLDSSNSGTRTRLGGRFFSNAKGVAGGVEDFSSPSHVLARPTPSRTRGARKGGSGEVP